MNRGLKSTCFIFLCFLFLFTSLAYSDEQKQENVQSNMDKQKQQQKQETTDTNNTAKEDQEKLGRWWLRNPLTYDPLPTKFLYHFEAEYDLAHDRGNLDRDKHQLNASLTLRKGRFTNYLRYEWDRRDAKRPDPPNEDTVLRDSTMQKIHEDFRYAITDKWYCGPGIIWETDDYIEIEERYRYYFGVGCNIITTPRCTFKIFGAYGRQEQEFTFSSNLGLDTEDADIVYVDQFFKYFITEYLAFNEWFSISQNIEDSDKYLYNLEFGVDFKIVEHVFGTIKYTIDYDNDPFPGVKESDEALSVGIKISI